MVLVAPIDFFFKPRRAVSFCAAIWLSVRPSREFRTSKRRSFNKSQALCVYLSMSNKLSWRLEEVQKFLEAAVMTALHCSVCNACKMQTHHSDRWRKQQLLLFHQKKTTTNELASLYKLQHLNYRLHGKRTPAWKEGASHPSVCLFLFLFCIRQNPGALFLINTWNI